MGLPIVSRLLQQLNEITHTRTHAHTHTHTVLESRIGDGLQQLEQDCHRLQIFAQKQPPTQRQAARK